MSKHIPKLKFLILLLVGLAGSIAYFPFAKAQTDDGGASHQAHHHDRAQGFPGGQDGP